MFYARIIAGAGLFALSAAPIRGQPVRAEASPIQVYLVTIGQGDPYWTSFGHNAIWIRDTGRATDLAYNWGLFDFNEPGFLGRFLSGNTRYWMAGFDATSMLGVYRSENRTIDIQELALSTAQAHALRDFVEWNALPENRTYRYDYYRDNCSTRVRDALDRVLGGGIRAATDTALTPHSYRWHTRRLLANHLPYYIGIQTILGRPADRAITKWDEMFVPMLLRDHIRAVRTRGERGAEIPLVKREWRMYSSTRSADHATPPNRTLWFGLISLGLAGFTVVLAGRAPRSTAARVAAAALASAWNVVAGIVGIAALSAWLFTQHIFMHYNETMLQLTPLSLALALLVPFAVRRSASDRTLRATKIVALAVLAASALGLVLHLIPGLGQANGEMIAFALPLHAAIAYFVTKQGRLGKQPNP